jgi:hypothetical protein
MKAQTSLVTFTHLLVFHVFTCRLFHSFRTSLDMRSGRIFVTASDFTRRTIYFNVSVFKGLCQ